MTVTLGDGRAWRGAADFPRGNPENPVSTVDLEQKFRELVTPRFGLEVAQNALAAVRGLERATDMSTVFRRFSELPTNEPAPAA
jgi:hypothetical protein